ncbi:MAG: DoxX family protein [Alphaproteobacteria bacterium]|nr:DoxX family protein [Alphaproteobacteria bacterium]MDX5369268.1 DoxX family protein [Alphaproteobacteria bacterium]MDX5463953.1 DoxX family protein [Alphaproteobacteria bacterium]
MSTHDTTPAPALHDLGDLIIRASAGLILVPHGAQKLFGAFGGHGLDGTAQFFSTQLGLEPAFLLALLVAVTEFFGGIALAAGLLTRVAALGIVVLMAVAAFHVHLGNGFFWTNGGYEYPLLWGLVALGYVLRGGNRYSLDRKLGLPV